jgi:multimeric flavodoxin WrbA
MEKRTVKILALQGSPRAEGNTQAVLEIVLDAAEQIGAESETIHLSSLSDLTGCVECFACRQEPDIPGCVIEDDMQPILEKAMRADLIVWATPVFCWSPAWPLKMAMDRFYCTFKFGKNDEIKSLLQGRKMAAVITAAGGEGDGADLVSETCRRLAAFSQTDWLGAFVAGEVRTPAAIRADSDLVNRARAFGRGLVA